MSYSGAKIDFLSVGDADAIFVRQYEGATMTTYLIDGGNKSDADLILKYLNDLNISQIDHLISTHSHADHIDGLVGVVEDKRIKIKQAWLNSLSEVRAAAMSYSKARSLVYLSSEIDRSAESEKSLVDALSARGIPISDAFQGRMIGSLEVMSPTRAFYDEMKREMLSDGLLRSQNDEAMGRAFAKYGHFGSSRASDGGGLGETDDTPENQVSLVLLYTLEPGTRCLLTSDAGIKALNGVLKRDAGVERLKNVGLLQVPHHGSRRNLTHDLIKYFSPKLAVASAIGSDKHPSKKVMDAFAAVGAKFYSTHCRKTPTGFNVGNVPQ